MSSLAAGTNQEPANNYVSSLAFDFMLSEILLHIERTTTVGEDQETVNEKICKQIEEMGFDTGYRFATLLVKNKNNLPVPLSDHPLEAVKFLCKDVWTSVFHKQVDKLQTNHRGVFVLKDLKFRWLGRFVTSSEASRTAAIKLLAFPCGLIRGALSNLGVEATVSCDFLSDGQNLSSCSFNVKTK